MTDDQGDTSSRDQLTATFIEVAIKLAAVALLLYAALVLVWPFVSIAIWSVVIAVALYPAFEWTARCLGGRRRLAATVITVATLLIVVGPATWLALGLIDSVRLIVERVDLSTLALPHPPASVKNWPLIGGQIYDYWDLASINLGAALAKIAPSLKPLGGILLGIAANAGIATVEFLAAIIVAGFLFAPAPALVAALKKFARRLESRRGEEFVKLAGATIRAVSRGVVGISALQAILAGLGLIVAGVPGASLITSTVLILGIIQIGPIVVLLPVVIWAWFVMAPTTAIMFTAYMLPVGLLDVVLRPIVMGRGLRVPMLVILIGVIGGTLAYGITGLFLGPIVLAVMWRMGVAWINEGEAG